MSNPLLIVKVGSLAVTHAEGGAAIDKIKNLAHDLAQLKRQGFQVILVSSGAINTGRSLISFDKLPTAQQISAIARDQALSALGQPALMKVYLDIFSEQKIITAQVLVTHEDFKNRERNFNIRNTLTALLHAGALPIINENDTVSFSEITVGDNDQLAGMVAQVMQADRLVLLTEADGLYTGNPQDPKSEKLTVVAYDADLSFIQFATKTHVGRGGMKTKIEAIRKLSPLGTDVYLASYDHVNPVSRALSGKAGTWFQAAPLMKKNKKSWLTTAIQPNCAVVIDEGAFKALSRGASLLPVGIRKVIGNFKRGDVVSIQYQRKAIACGRIEYGARELNLLKGLASDLWDEAVTKKVIVTSEVAVHRDNLFIKATA